MYIKTLELNNIRSFKEAKLECSKNINIIIGANNSGKSTLLKALYKLQDKQALAIEDIRKKEFSGNIFLEIDDINDKEKTLYKNSGLQNLPTTSTGIVFLMVQKEQTGFIVENRLALNNLEKLQGLRLGHVAQPFKELPSSEDKHNFIYPFFAKRKARYYSSSGNQEATFSVYDDFRNLPAKVLKATSQPSIRKAFEEICIDILGFQVTHIPGDNNNENKLGVYASDTELIPLEAMGEGVANIIGLITILLTQDRKLFLIEELENDIHPQALKKLLNLIIEKSENNQFFISTHSNIILKYLGSLPDTRIFYTASVLDSGHHVPTSVIQPIENTPLERRKLLEELGYDFFDYELYGAYLLFEESSAERIVREILIPEFIPELQGSIRTIAAQGTGDLLPKFNDLHRLFMYLHTSEVYKDRAWVLADGDQSGKGTIEKLKQKFVNWEASHFINFSKPYIELYYPEHFQDEVKQIMQHPDRRIKQEMKGQLTEKIIKWHKEHKEDAREAFSTSASEIVEILRNIAKHCKTF